MGTLQSPLVRHASHWQTYLRSGIPDYLAKNYWWAYLSPWGVRFFDHPWTVNRILWGQYHKIAKSTVVSLAAAPIRRLAEISCAYGEIIPMVARESGADSITLLDVAPIQLQSARNKLRSIEHSPVRLLRANAERLPLADASFDAAMLFFLLHELPKTVRQRALAEAVRILQPKGRLLIADYAELTTQHEFHRSELLRSVFEKLEPFLGEFWQTNLLAELEFAARSCGKSITLTRVQTFWHGFYRLLELKVD